MSFHHRLVPGLFRGSKLSYGLALTAVGLAALAAYVPPLLLRSILDSGLGSAPWTLPEPLQSWTGSAIPRAVALMVAFSLTAAGLNFLANFGAQRTAESWAQRLREHLYAHLQRLRYDVAAQAPTGDWVQRCTTDVDTMRRLWALQGPELATNVFQAAWAIPLLFWLQPELAWFAFPLVPVVLAFSTVFFLKIQKAFRASDESEGRLSAILQEVVVGVRVVKAFARQDSEIDRFRKENQHYRTVTRKVVNLFATYWGTVNLMAMLQTGLVLFTGTVFVLDGRVSVGTVVLFLTMSGMLIWPIRQLGRVLTDIGKAQIAWSRLGEILNAEVEDPETAMDGTRTPLGQTLTGRIVFDHVSVTRGTTTVLRDVSFVIEAGSTAALLGPTGSGKTTLVLVLAGLLDYEGAIWLDDRELRTIPRGELRDQVALVLQEPYLFAKTIERNIGLAHADSETAEIVAASQSAHLHDVVLGFHHGYETLLGERGVTLSGGQRQRTAIAQMLVRRHPIVVFDDSLSAVDNETDAKIRRALRRQAGTRIFISHRVSSLAQADSILVIDQGRLVQQGRPDDLVRVPGLYRTMAQLQNALKDEWALSEA